MESETGKNEDSLEDCSPCEDSQVDGKIAEEEEENEGSEAVSPSSLVLAIFATYISSLDDLKRSRLVSRLWRDMTLEHWRSFATLRIYPCWKAGMRRFYQVGNDGLEIDQLFLPSPTTGEMEAIPELLEQPFQRHKIISVVYLPPEAPKDTEGLYWEEYGPHLRSLRLLQTFFQKGREVEGFEWIFKNCRNLRELIMAPFGTLNNEQERLSASDKEQIVKDFIVSKRLQTLTICHASGSISRIVTKPLFTGNTGICRKFLKMVPFLKELSLEIEPGSFLEALKIPVTDAHFIHLSKLLIKPEVAVEGLKLLTEYLETSKTPLKVLELKVNWNETRKEPRYLRRIFRKVEGTLTKLNLEISMFYEAHQPPFWEDLTASNFKNLTELRLKFVYGYSSPSSQLPFDFGALKKMKNLRRFHCLISGIEAEAWITQKVTEKELECLGGTEEEMEGSLNYLEEFELCRKISPEGLRVLKKWMPRLRVIGGVLDSQTFPVIREIWPSVEKIKLMEFSKVPEAMKAEQSKIGIKIEANDLSNVPCN